MRRSSLQGLTLVELLAVIGILAVLAAMAYPVFAASRENGRGAACAANEEQMAKAMHLYLNDNNDQYPATTYIDYPGVGWATALVPYTKTYDLFRCPSDGTDPQPPHDRAHVISYGLNCNLSGVRLYAPFPKKTIDIDIPAAASTQVASPARTVLFFEASDAFAEETYEIGPPRGPDFDTGSPSGNTVNNPAGPPNRNLVPFPLSKWGVHPYGPSSFVPLYATGNVGGRQLNDNLGSRPRHGEGANYVAADGHCQWLRPNLVSGGEDAANEPCPQGTVAPQPQGCDDQTAIRAAGSGFGSGSGGAVLTFSRR